MYYLNENMYGYMSTNEPIEFDVFSELLDYLMFEYGYLEQSPESLKDYLDMGHVIDFGELLHDGYNVFAYRLDS